MAELTLHPTLVEPFYLHFMNANLVTLDSADQRSRILGEFRERLPDYSEPLLREMLASSWRPAKVAAWAIAAKRVATLVPEVGRRLLSQPAYAEHFAICLACFAGPQSETALTQYLAGCADGTLLVGQYDETVVPDWVYAAKEHLAGEARPDDLNLWSNFLSRQAPGMASSWANRLAAARELFPRVIRVFDELHDVPIP